ncbi:IS5 family transposase [Nocardia takedensis]|uniref:IS5 family transposase n=1 Tax=Nocardia takedensis TaxID=259390 RepID=UPI003F7601D9
MRDARRHAQPAATRHCDLGTGHRQAGFEHATVGHPSSARRRDARANGRRRSHAAADGAGRGLAVLLTPGQAGDSPILPVLLEAVVVPRLEGGPPRRHPDAVIADKAYSSAANRELLRRRGIRTVIPERADQIVHRKRRGRRGGRPPGFDRDTYKRRNVIERAFSRAKHWRAVATRYDKLACCYRGGVVMALIVEWLRSLGDRT